MKVQDINPFGVRMPSELKQLLDFEAKKNTRSLNSEIVARLWESLGRNDRIEGKLGVTEVSAPHYGAQLNGADKAILAIFRKLSVEKQLALISLFK
ncbi:MAG: Arc family DNA-binding protein [Burkholderiales bacterium]|nr:Arc family DNA-binding protein [Burkholderiales bacterium]MDP3714935.1 Arc family DNA-binding protein [Burkholderiales bacterium]